MVKPYSLDPRERVVAAVAARGVFVSYYAVWRFFARAGVTFKKKPARGRTGSPRRGQTARYQALDARAATSLGGP